MLRDEAERHIGYFTPSMVNSQGMPAIRDFLDQSFGGILLLLLVRSMGNCPRHGVVILARDNEQRSTVRILGVDLGFGPRIEIGAGSLEDRHSRAGHRIFFVQFM